MTARNLGEELPFHDLFDDYITQQTNLKHDLNVNEIES